MYSMPLEVMVRFYTSEVYPNIILFTTIYKWLLQTLEGTAGHKQLLVVQDLFVVVQDLFVVVKVLFVIVKVLLL